MSATLGAMTDTPIVLPEPVTVTVGTVDFDLPAGPLPDGLPGDVRFHVQALTAAVPAVESVPTPDSPEE